MYYNLQSTLRYLPSSEGVQVMLTLREAPLSSEPCGHTPLKRGRNLSYGISQHNTVQGVAVLEKQTGDRNNSRTFYTFYIFFFPKSLHLQQL